MNENREKGRKGVVALITILALVALFNYTNVSGLWVAVPSFALAACGYSILNIPLLVWKDAPVVTPGQCRNWQFDEEAGPKWCGNCGHRRHLHPGVPSEFDPDDESTW